MAGVEVTIASPALQSSRVELTDETGVYRFTALPPGRYALTFRRDGFETVSEATTVPLGLTVDQMVTLHVDGVRDVVDVVAEAPPRVAMPGGGANFARDEIDALANPRTPQGIAPLAPAVTENAPNANQIVINGAFAFDNAFMIDGVDINDNIFATPQDLYIEDAIQETQVLTSGIPAEYGRFTGGVVNAITRSGGNTFAGSLRTNFSNPSWTAETPFERDNGIRRAGDVQETYEVTFGGPLRRERLWFFLAGRLADTTVSNTLPQTAVAYEQQRDRKRGELKLTGTFRRNQTVQFGYVKNASVTTNDSGALSLVIDPASLVTRRRPNRYVLLTYRGVAGDRMLAEAQYAERRSSLAGGGTSTDLRDSTFAAGVNLPLGLYNAPVLDSSDPDERNNRQLTASLTRFWNRVGRHETKSGYEFYRSQIRGGNSQSSTQYVFLADYATGPDGTPRYDAAGRLMPVFRPPSQGLTLAFYYPATRGATLDNDTHAVYAQDHWTLSDRMSADVGFRFEYAHAVSTGDITSVDNHRLVPRLALSYDLTGTGRYVAHVTYGRYSGRYDEAQINRNSPVGNPPEITNLYVGPPGEGRDFGPGFDLGNYVVVGVSDPKANVFMDSDLKSALVHEATLSLGGETWNGRGYGQATYVYRRTTDMVDDFITVADGVTVIPGAGTFSRRVFRNAGQANRTYQALVLESRYRASAHWTFSGHYTVQLENDGNFEGEAPNQPGATSIIGDYPEAFSAARYYPRGKLANFQRHRLRVWGIYQASLGRYGELLASGLWRVDSGRAYSLVATNQPLTDTQRAIIDGAGYPELPRSGGSLFFGDRGSQRFRGAGLFDLALRWDVPDVDVPFLDVRLFPYVRPWIKLEVYNLLNNQKLIGWNTVVRPDPTSPLDELGLATGYIEGPSFGAPRSPADFPAPFGGLTGGRTIRVAVGVRF